MPKKLLPALLLLFPLTAVAAPDIYVQTIGGEIAEESKYANTTTSAPLNIVGEWYDPAGAPNITWTCPTCTPSSGSATISGAGFIISDVAVSCGGLGANLVTNSGFDTDTDWKHAPYSGNEWIIANGMASSASTTWEVYLEQSLNGLSEYAWYQVAYDIAAYTSGDLYLSQWGFQGRPNITLSNAIGSHTVDGNFVAVSESPVRLLFESIKWGGSLDNVYLRQKGTRNIITITATDSSSNETTINIYVNGYDDPDAPIPGRGWARLEGTGRAVFGSGHMLQSVGGGG